MVRGNARRYHILYLVASSHGGGATHLRDLVLGLPKDRYTCMVVMPLDGGNVSPADFIEAGIEFMPLSIDRGLAGAEVFRLRRLLKTGKFDFLHLHGARAALYGRLAVAMLPSRPQVGFSIHGFATPFHPPLKRTLYLFLERLLQRVTDHTIAVAQAEADLFLSFGLAKPSKISVIHYGIDLKRFFNPDTDPTYLRKEFKITEQSHVILTVCRLNVPRDFVSLLIAFKQVLVQFPTAYLLIVGDGPQRIEVETQIRQLGLDNAAHITGFRYDVPALMKLAAVYVLTSFSWEGYPISTLEAQAAGVPVVVTDAGGSKEAVSDGKTGLVVPKRRPNLLADALLLLLQKPDLRQQMGQAGQQRAASKFAREQMIKKMTGLYDTLIRKTK